MALDYVGVARNRPAKQALWQRARLVELTHDGQARPWPRGADVASARSNTRANQAICSGWLKVQKLVGYAFVANTAL